MNNKGPRIDPWGTPDCTGNHEEYFLLIITLCTCKWLIRKHLTHHNRWPLTPIAYNNFSCGTESKALEKFKSRQLTDSQGLKPYHEWCTTRDQQ